MFENVSNLQEEEEGEEKCIMDFEGNSLISRKDQCVVGVVEGEIKALLFYFLSFQNTYQ